MRSTSLNKYCCSQNIWHLLWRKKYLKITFSMENICRTHSNDPVVGGSGIRSNSSFPPADGDSILLLHGGLIQTTKVTIDNCLSHGHRQQLLMYTHVQIQRWRYQQIYFVISQTIDGAAIMKLPVGGLYSLYMNNQFDHHKWHILYTFNPGVRIYLFFMPNFYPSLLLWALSYQLSLRWTLRRRGGEQSADPGIITFLCSAWTLILLKYLTPDLIPFLQVRMWGVRIDESSSPWSVEAQAAP